MNVNSKTDNRDSEGAVVSRKFVKPAIIGVIVGGAGFLLYKLLRTLGLGHTIPPIIIKSTEESGEPIEIETEQILVETESVSGQVGSSLLLPKSYTMPDFDLTRYVGIYRYFPQPGHLTEFKNNDGLEVRAWLQYKWGGEWEDEEDGPHLIVEVTEQGSSLTCDQLSDNKPNSNPHRPYKRSFNKNKKWRISQVQVDNHAPISLDHFKKMEIRLDKEFHEHKKS